MLLISLAQLGVSSQYLIGQLASSLPTLLGSPKLHAKKTTHLGGSS